MFRIECFVDDKHLPKVLIALEGLAYNVQARPVINAQVEKGKVVAEGEPKPSYIKVYERLIHNGKSKGDLVLSSDIKEAVIAEKLSPAYYGGITTHLLEEGFLERLERGKFKFHSKAT